MKPAETLLFEPPTKPTTALLRSRLGARVRWQKRDRVTNGYTFEGRTGTGHMTEVKGRNVCIGGDWFWIPDLARMWIIPQD